MTLPSPFFDKTRRWKGNFLINKFDERHVEVELMILLLLLLNWGLEGGSLIGTIDSGLLGVLPAVVNVVPVLVVSLVEGTSVLNSG